MRPVLAPQTSTLNTDHVRTSRLNPFKHPLLWSACIPTGAFFLALYTEYMLELPETGLVFAALSLMLWLGWCLWLTAFALAPRHSWATPLRTRFRASCTVPSPLKAEVVMGVIFILAVPYIVFISCSGLMIFMGEVAEEVWPESALTRAIGLNDRAFIETFGGCVASAMAVVGVLNMLRTKRGSQEGVYQCLNCGHGSATQPEARCPECGETNCFTFTASNRSTAE